MNRIYRSIWNQAARTFIAAAENVGGGGAPCASSSTAVPGEDAATGRRGLRRPTIRPLALEQRFMFDGAVVATGVEAAAKAVQTTADAAAVDHSATPQAVVFVDARVQDKNKLLANGDSNAQVVMLDQKSDGLDQIAAYLAGHHDVGSVQIVAHGWEGNLWLGSTFVDQASLEAHQGDLAGIGQALKPGGDILVYACDTAAGADGLAFVNTLSQLTGADVAASDNRTGAGGDWKLEIATGSIEAAPALSSDAMATYGHSLATQTVSNGNDSGAGSLRSAIASAGAGDTITFSGVSTVSLTSGQLLINKNVTIDGDLNNDGSPDVTIDAGYKSRVLYVWSGSTVTLDGLVIQHGLLAGDGGQSRHVIGDSVYGAGIYNQGTLTLLDVNVTANAAAGGGGGGGNNSGYVGGGGGGGGGIGGGLGGAAAGMRGTCRQPGATRESPEAPIRAAVAAATTGQICAAWAEAQPVEVERGALGSPATPTAVPAVRRRAVPFRSAAAAAGQDGITRAGPAVRRPAGFSTAGRSM